MMLVRAHWLYAFYKKVSRTILALTKKHFHATTMRMKIVVVGKGGREHALVSTLANSPGVSSIYCWPGSDAIARIAGKVEIAAGDLEGFIVWMQKNAIDLCVAGEESYLVSGEGLANKCKTAGIPCWGPSRQCAQLEASKQFAKEFLNRHAIPTGTSVCVDNIDAARSAINNTYPTVLKFDGLAAGKGVAVCMDQAQAEEFLAEVFTAQRFGAGQLLIEEFLQGPEVSIFASVCDDKYQILCPARDYKRLGDGDVGPNTGGMGAVASLQLISKELLQTIEQTIVAPTVAGLMQDGLPYRGFLYFGLMLTKDGPKVIEYNCRFGDPECQAVMPLLKGNLAAYCLQAAKGEFDPSLISFDESWSLCVVQASYSYPQGSRSGDVISGIENVSDAKVFHAGTALQDGHFVTNGGRVLAVVAQAATRLEAVRKVYEQAAKIDFAGKQQRSDIGIANCE